MGKPYSTGGYVKLVLFVLALILQFLFLWRYCRKTPGA